VSPLKYMNYMQFGNQYQLKLIVYAVAEPGPHRLSPFIGTERIRGCLQTEVCGLNMVEWSTKKRRKYGVIRN
jgi:hypothetical protein